MIIVSISACGGNKITKQQSESNGTKNYPPSVQNLDVVQQPTTTAPSPSADNSGSNVNKVTIASYSTILLDRDSDRINNIEITIEEINGYTMQPGEVFSFNTIVGKRKVEKGYEKAKTIVNGKSKEALGGGICQLSSTIYNAVRKANLEVVERHSHSKDVHYVPKGQDAAVNYGTQDFKFRNNMSYPITLYVSLANGKVYASIQK
jgi:vancomycin resistance protein YoaR